jgi:mRNA interferase YafQ
MLILATHRRFEKDLRLAMKRGRKAARLWQVVEQLQAGSELAARHRPHKLLGEWHTFWECHIEPDWLLIYRITATHLELVRTGTHADLF